MKALSVKQPWAELIVRGAKPLEIRGRPVHYRGPLAIHASQRWDGSSDAKAAWFGARSLGEPVEPSSLPLGRVVGVVDLDGCHRYMPEDQPRALTPWKPDRWAWLMTRPRRADSPFPVRGQLGLWEIPDSAVQVTA